MTTSGMALDVASNLAKQDNSVPPQSQFQAQLRVPAFLNKLYALVNDPETNEYVRWNDAGTSFIIPNSQLMAENVLPRSFKTINFASFVRQLNMYGFHKVPHLNDGALHTENTPEVWEFTNEHFTRDNPDLPSIVRKKNEAERARSAKRQGTPEPKQRHTAFPAIEAPPSLASSADMTVVYEEIRNIKRLQTSVIGELKRLKTDNEALWAEAADARARYDQQQSTINKMLKFLSTVFSPSKSNAGSIPSRNKGLITGPPAFEELGDDSVDSVLTPEAQETGARELSKLFGGAQPILPINAGDASWWQNLVKSGSDSGMFNLSANLPPPSYTSPTDALAPYELPPTALTEHEDSLAAMEQAVNQTDQSIDRICNVLGVNDWDNFNFPAYQQPDVVTYDPFLDMQNVNAPTEYKFEDFIHTDENGAIPDQNENDTKEKVSTEQPRFESLSREVTPKPKDRLVQNQVDDGTRKRTRSQSSGQGASPLQKKTR